MAGYGDIRTARRGEALIEAISGLGTVNLRRLGAGRAGEMGAHRFLSSPHASVEAIIDTASERTREAAQGLDVVCAQDTTEINFAGSHGKRGGLGPGGNGDVPGLFVHALISIDATSEAVLGLSGARTWTRSEQPLAPRHLRAPKDKESSKWLEGAQRAQQALAGASTITVVGDRESDIFHLFSARPEGVELVVRARQDRPLARPRAGAQDDVVAQTRWMHEAVANAPREDTIAVAVAPKGPGDRGRTATVEVRRQRVQLAPARGHSGEPVEVFIVEAREINPPEPAPNARPPLHWVLIATQDRPGAQIIQLYKLRWRIEEVFRCLKSDGLAIEDTQVRDPERLFRLVALAMCAAARTMQLVDARDGSTRPDTDILDPVFRTAVKALSDKLEGKTDRQKNPHPVYTLAYVAWVCARLGGWNCYYKPPGPKTMRTGWSVLSQTLTGYTLALNSTTNQIP